MDFTNVFTVTPMSRKVELKAGETYTGTVVVANPMTAEQNFAYKVSVAPYSVEGTMNNANFATESLRSQITKWITIDKPSGVLAPNESAEITYTITVPEDAPGGGQYAAIMVGSDNTAPQAQGVNIQNIYEIASIIYARVDGEIKRSGEITENDIPGFVTAMPLTVSTELQNSGNIHETASVRVTVNNFLNGSQVYPAEGEDGILEEIVMPDSSRMVSRELGSLSPVGLYQITQSVTYMGQTSSNSQLVVACPVWFMAMVALTLGVIIYGITRAIVKHRKIKRSIV